jgi:putative SOS response-associated peptidase YedK
LDRRAISENLNQHIIRIQLEALMPKAVFWNMWTLENHVAQPAAGKRIINMCGRYGLGESSWAEYHDALSIINQKQTKPRFNIAPTQSAPICYASGNTLKSTDARWWFVPSWHKGDVKDWKATTFNAKIETAREKPTFRSAWKNNRCIVPATGYYEWTGEKGKKQPWYISVNQNVPVFFFAGLYSKRPDGQFTYTILTRDAEAEIAQLHKRMPVILHSEQLMSWLNNSVEDDQVIDDYGSGWGEQYQYRMVEPFGVRDDGPEIIEDFGSPALPFN